MLELLVTSKRQVPFSIKILSQDNDFRYLFMKLISLLAPDMEESLYCALLYDITAFISDKTTHMLKIPVGVKNEIKLIDLKDVIFIEADNVYGRVHTERNDYFSGLSIGTFHDRLPKKYFFRIHRSYLINLTKITKVFKERGAVYVSLQGIQEKLPVSRGKSKEFLKILGLK
jgi:DNA-binding LytR/AlgR family response regulator